MRWKLVRWLTIQATNLSSVLLRKRKWKFTQDDYRKMPVNSIGYCLIKNMDENKIPFKPNLVKHDVKHIILGYKMDLPDEIRICAFQLGNRCHNSFSLIYMIVCTAIVPEIIPTLKKDFKRGRNATCLKHIDLENFVAKDLTYCQKLWKL